MEQTWDVHPDLALTAHEEKREICCLAVEEADGGQIGALASLGAFGVYREDRGAALLYGEDFAGQAALEEALCGMGLQGGLSGPFALAASARGCMLKAQLALETGRAVQPGRALYLMGEMGEEALVRAACGALESQGLTASDFCDAAIGRMAAMDAQKDTQYVRSLDVYLSCGMDMKRAAERLGVHRNTLSYRLDRVQALFGLDLKDVSRCFELLFSLWLTHRLPDAQHAAAVQEAPFDTHAAQSALWRHVERSGRVGAAPAADFPCVLLVAGVGGLADEGRAALLGRLRSCAPQQTAFAFDEDVVLMALPPHGLAELEEKARTVCAGLGCPLVVTQEFPASRIAQRAKLCRMALCAGAGLYVRTRDLCSTLFFMAVERRVALSPYLCEEVIRVMDDDAQKGTALSRSLYAYLLHFRDLKRAAQQLGMHRNTMEYHIRKIDALIGEDATERRRFMMMCTYKMLALPEISRFGL